MDQFRRTMPLITDLKNPAMRDRHWDQIQELVNTFIYIFNATFYFVSDFKVNNF